MRIIYTRQLQVALCQVPQRRSFGTCRGLCCCLRGQTDLRGIFSATAVTLPRQLQYAAELLLSTLEICDSC